MTVKQDCDMIAKKLWPSDNRYPFTNGYDMLRIYRRSASRSDIAQMGIDEEEIALSAIYFMFSNSPVQSILQLDDGDLVTLKSILYAADQFLKGFAEPKDWAADEYRG